MIQGNLQDLSVKIFYTGTRTQNIDGLAFYVILNVVFSRSEPIECSCPCCCNVILYILS